MKRQHEPLRIPERWSGQDRAFVIQLERSMDDIYIILGNIEEALSELEKRVKELEET